MIIFFNLPTIYNSYIAGFIAADGYLAEKRNKIVIKLSDKDDIILKNISSLINYTGTLKYYHYIDKKNQRKHKCVVLVLNGASKLITDLHNIFNIYCKDKKIGLLQPPTKLINKDHILSYICGYIDGDGCISISNNHFKLSIIGSEVLCEWIKENIIKYFGNEFDTKIYKHSQCNMYMYSISGIRKILKLYTETKKIPDLEKLLLKRKWNKIEDYLNEY